MSSFALTTAAGTRPLLSLSLRALLLLPLSLEIGALPGAGTAGAGGADDDDDDDEDDEDDDEVEMDDDDDDDDEDETDEIDPTVILPAGRRTRGIKVDYTSKEALHKAGLKPEDEGYEEDEESFAHDDDAMKD